MTLLLLPLALLAVPAPAIAAGGLSYEAPAGCPTQPEFADNVTAHDGDLGSGDAADPGRVLVVAIRKEDRVFVGSFHVRRPSGATNAREVRGQSCREVADALAMVTAIALHPPPAQPVGDTPATSPPPPSRRTIRRPRRLRPIGFARARKFLCRVRRPFGSTQATFASTRRARPPLPLAARGDWSRRQSCRATR